VKEYLHRFSFWAFLAAIASLQVAYFSYQYQQNHPSLSSLAAKIQHYLHKQENQMEEDLRDTVLVNELLNQTIDEKRLKWLNEKPYELLLYKDDSLLFWSDNKALPTEKQLNGTLYDRLIHLKNAYYEIVKNPISLSSNENFQLIGLLPVKYDYPIDNQYLKSKIAFPINTPGYLAFSTHETLGSKVILNEEGDTLFYIYFEGLISSPEPGIMVKVFLLLFLFFSVLFIDRIANEMAKRAGPVAGLIFLASFLILIRFLMLQNLDLNYIKNLDLFSPLHYASSFLSPSLGDFSINCLSIFWLSVYFRKRFRTKFILSNPQYIVLRIFAYLLLIANLFLISLSVQGLVIDSNISLDINNFLTLDIFSFIALSDIAFLYIAFFLFTMGFLSLIPEKRTFYFSDYLSFIIASLLILPLIIYVPLRINRLWIYVGAALFLAIRHFVHRRKIPFSSFTAIIIWLIFFSAFGAILLNRFNTEKELNRRSLFLTKLENSRDPVFEFHFYDVHDKLQSDVLALNYFKNPVISKKSLSDRISFLYFREWLNQYNISIESFAADSSSYKNARILRFDDYLSVSDDVRDSKFKDLEYISPYPGVYYYRTLLTIKRPGQVSGSGFLSITFKPKSLSYSNVYPELLLENKIIPTGEYDLYDYAVYSNSQLVKSKGDYPYRLFFHSTDTMRYAYISEGGYNHLIHEINSGISLWVSKRDDGKMIPVSLFSYLFCYFLLIILCMLFIRWIVKWVSGSRLRISWSEMSFRNRIQFIIIFIIVITFLSIGFLTIWNISSQYDAYHHARLNRKVTQVMAGLENFRHQGHDDNNWNILYQSPDLLAKEVSNLSHIHSMDINIFDTNGDLISSSQTAIFDKGLLTRKINPMAYYQIVRNKKSKFINEERVGALRYLASYVPLLDQSGHLQAIVNLPYFAKEQNLRNEISSFLVYFINVYVLLLVLAGIIAVFISNTVTRSLKVIGDKLKQVQLGKPNEPIQWPNNDEIGQLIRQYNRMIKELEISAVKLARSERESAWREMAKQVAHEIKNPLTPMKLSIQHLQRAWMNKDPNIGPLIKKTTHTLVDQIENLSNIADEFSNFAKMPKAKKSKLDLTALLQSMRVLYQNESAEISFKYPDEKIFVFADKDQILRVFNNLIKNALQAIPENRVGRIKIVAKVRKKSVTIRINDNGVGILPEQEKQVFTPKFTTKSSGMGLGLAISQNVIHSHGGEIWFESKPPEGTDFFIRLPLLTEK